MYIFYRIKRFITMHSIFGFTLFISFFGGFLVKKYINEENRRQDDRYEYAKKNLNSTNLKYSLKIDDGSDIEEIIAEENENTINSMIIKDDDVADSYVNMTNNYLEKVPENIKEKLENEGWNIHITNKNLADEFKVEGYDKISGLTVYEEKNIYVEARSTAIKSSLIHEIGHAIDSSSGFISQNNDFNDIYKNEQNSFVESGNEDSSYGTTSNIEYFAESFNQFIQYPQQQNENTPETFKYMENLVENY